MTEKNIPDGQKVKRLREILGIKQEAVAIELGLSQQAISDLERKEALSDDVLKKIAKVLNVTPEAIRNFSEESVVYNIQNNHEGSTNNTNIDTYNYQCDVNPLKEFVEQVKENKRLNEENKQLYQSLLKVQEEKIALLEKMLAMK